MSHDPRLPNSLTDRDARISQTEQMIYGVNPVMEALRAPDIKVKKIWIARGRRGSRLEKIDHLAERRHVPVVYGERDELTALTKSRFHQGVVAMTQGYLYAPLEGVIERWKKSGARALILVLDSIQDPQNLGALVRTANVCGAHGVIIPKDRSAGITPAVVKASAGATAFTPVARVTNIAATLDRLKKEEGIWIMGAVTSAPKSLFRQDLDVDLAVVVGSEGQGIRPLVLSKCDFTVSIPVIGEISSLNASVAAGVILYEIVRQRLNKKTNR